MHVMIIGGGGREHALTWKLAQSPRVGKITCVPGNGGMAALAECIPVPATDMEEVLALAGRMRPDLVVVAPDDPLAAGMVDRLQAMGLRAFGPVRAAAALEGSKVFSKTLMAKYGIPTASHRVFDRPDEALSYLDAVTYPIVVKADGLALGKGVIIAGDRKEAAQAVKAMMQDRIFGRSGTRIVVESFLKGPEISLMAFTDGKTLRPMVSAQDHKKIFDGDAGPNTGGMGAISPSPHYTDAMAARCRSLILDPTMAALEAEGIRFRGVLYFGLILTDEGPKVLEYNARFGDPEAQAVMPLLKTDLLEILLAVTEDRLDRMEIHWSEQSSACVMAASGGYPGKYETGFPITGLPEADTNPDIVVFHSGTRREADGIKTAGGRVLGVTAVAPGLREALDKAYDALSRIHFHQMHYRKDIGKR